MRRNVTWMFAAVTLLSSVALAAPDGKDAPQGDDPGRHHGRHGGHADDADDDDDDAGAMPKITRTPAQDMVRRELVRQRREAIEAAVKKNGKPLTQAQRQAIGMHWRHIMRLLRIREIAEDAKDSATMTRVDGLIARATKHFDDKFSKLTSDAPAGAVDGGAK